jgi:hypothetical protein
MPSKHSLMHGAGRSLLIGRRLMMQAPYKWVVASWTRTFDYANISTINATFREVFEP